MMRQCCRIDGYKPTGDNPHLVPRLLILHELETAQWRQLEKIFETENKPFLIRCDAGESGQLSSSTKRASITVGQRILRDGAERMWDSVVVLCRQEDDGALAIRVVLCHPEWDEPREIAVIRSGQKDAPLGVRIRGGRQVGEAEWSESRPHGRWKK